MRLSRITGKRRRGRNFSKIVLLAALAALAVPAGASALTGVSTTTVNTFTGASPSPVSSGGSIIYNTAVPPTGVTINGTTDSGASTGSCVALWAYQNDADILGLQGFGGPITATFLGTTTVSNHAFSLHVPFFQLLFQGLIGNEVAIRALPDPGTAATFCFPPTSPPGPDQIDLSAYTPGYLGIDGVENPTIFNADDFAAVLAQPAGEWAVHSMGDGGVTGSLSLYDQNLDSNAVGIAASVAALGEGRFGGVNQGDEDVDNNFSNIPFFAFIINNLPPAFPPFFSTTNNPAVSVDGTAMTLAADSDPTVAVAPTTAVNNTLPDASGDVTITDTEFAASCVNQPAHVTPDGTGAACGSYVNSDGTENPIADGILLTRNTTTGADGASITVADTITNLDHFSHTVTLRYLNQFNLLPAFSFGYGASGATPLKGPLNPDDPGPIAGAGSSKPYSVLVEGQRLLNDASSLTDDGSVTYETTPNDIFGLNQYGYEAEFSETIPSGGSVTLTQIINQAPDLQDAEDAASAQLSAWGGSVSGNVTPSTTSTASQQAASQAVVYRFVPVYITAAGSTTASTKVSHAKSTKKVKKAKKHKKSKKVKKHKK
jgi:hypothetical protein